MGGVKSDPLWEFRLRVPNSDFGAAIKYVSIPLLDFGFLGGAGNFNFTLYLNEHFLSA